MQRLHQLLNSLNPQQVKVLRNYLTSFSTRDGNTKYWKLASLLLKNKERVPSVKECSEKIYRSQPDGRIEQLKNRVYAKVLDSLLIDINTNRDISGDVNHPVQIKLRKKMLLYDLLKYTSLRESVGLEMIKDIVAPAREHELFVILLDALYILKWNYGLRKGADFFNKLNKEIEQAEKWKRYAQRAQDLYVQLGQFSTFNTKADKNRLIEFLNSSIAELKQYYLESGVKSIGYFMRTFEMTSFQLNKEPEKAKEAALAIIDLMDANKVIAFKIRYGVCYSYIAEFEAEMGHYEQAINYINKARPFMGQSVINTAVSKRLELNIYILKDDFHKAIEIADDLLKTSPQVTGDFRRDIIFYFKACCHFMLGEYRECARLLGQKFQLTRDKLGWEVNIRFMRIMTLVEQNKPDEAFSMVQSLHKHMERYKQIKDLSERDHMLLMVFRELAREGFAFQRPTDKVYRYLLLLLEKGKPHSWEPLSPELIRIHDWIIRKYEHFVPPAPAKKKTEPREKVKGNA